MKNNLSKIDNINIDFLKECVESSTNFNELLPKLGYDIVNKALERIKYNIEINNIDISHFKYIKIIKSNSHSLETIKTVDAIAYKEEIFNKILRFCKFRGGQCLSTEYTKARFKMKFKCSIAEHPSWEAAPYRILEGHWCKECSYDARRLPSNEALIWDYYKVYERAAIYRNLVFDVSLKKFKELINQNCLYCGVAPSLKKSRKSLKGTSILVNGLDRKDSNIGYIDTNIVTCCKTCNCAKMSMNFEEYNSYIRLLLEHNAEKFGFVKIAQPKTPERLTS